VFVVVVVVVVFIVWRQLRWERKLKEFFPAITHYKQKLLAAGFDGTDRTAGQLR